MGLSKQFISCDWGTSSFRLRLIESESVEVVAELRSEQGIRAIHELGQDAFKSHLEEQIATLPSPQARHIMLSGMASSTIGWRELSYAETPLRCDGSNLVRETIPLGGREVFLISGAATKRDIMRGEETEVIGILNHPRFSTLADDCVVILPGTHSKHIRIRERVITDWQTFMTGELFEALTKATILKQTTDTRDMDKEAVREGVQTGFERGMESGLFGARVRGVLDGASNASNRGYLSGLLIGSELRRTPTGLPILLAGPEQLREVYLEACDVIGRSNVHRVDLPGGPAIFGHAFLLKRWLSAEE